MSLKTNQVTLSPARDPSHQRSFPLPSNDPGAQQNDVASQTVDIRHLLAPIRPGLQRVEAKMKTVDSSLFAPLANAFLELIGSGGKRLRPALALLAAEFNDGFNNGVQDSPAYERLIALAAAVEMLHTSSLVHDDVIDGSILRRGAPTLNAIWGGSSTVLAGNYMFGSAALFSAQTQHARVIRIFSDTLKIMVDGELRQLRDRNNYQQEKSVYYHRIYAKTASLFCAATEGAAVLSGLPEDQVQRLRDYGYHFGMAFQIMDDILDFTGNEEMLGKPAGSDLLQGTLTLPFFYYLQQHPKPDVVIERLQSSKNAADEGDATIWQSVVRHIVQELRRTPAVEAARQEALDFLDLARASLALFPENVYKQALIGLCDFVVQRTY